MTKIGHIQTDREKILKRKWYLANRERILQNEKIQRLKKRPTTEERFWKHVIPEPNSGCWLWVGSLDTNGYGSFKINGRLEKSHRFSYEFYRLSIPCNLVIDHICRVRSCVNPDHLEIVTVQENISRGIVGINMRQKTHCPQGHPYAGENLVIDINGARICRECRNRRARERRRNNQLKSRDRGS